MINVSDEFKALMERRTNFLENAEITFADGTILNLSPSNFTVSNNAIIDGAGASTIPLGVAICRNIQIELANFDDSLSDYDFYGAKIRLYLTYQLSETVEEIEEGTFTVVTPETQGTTIFISAVDDMYKADNTYTTNLVFPTTLGAMLTDICTTCGIVQDSTEFTNSDFVVDTMPSSDYTFRQMIGFIAMIAGGNARIDRNGKLQVITYNFDMLWNTATIDGGDFERFESEIVIDGGDFESKNTNVINGGNFTSLENDEDVKLESIHLLKHWKNLKVDTDDITITGISTKLEDDTIVLNGTEEYVLDITNPLIVGKEADVLSLIGMIMIDGTFRQFEGDHIGYPLAEFMDQVLIFDRKGNQYQSFITDIDFNFCGYTTIKNSAEQVLRNSSKYYSDTVKIYQETKKLVEKEKTEREAMIDNLSQELAKNSSMFTTQEEQLDGGSIYYVHNKPTLAESSIVWKMTVEAIGFSTDGGKTYPYALDVSGMAVLERIYAVGINANYITTGAFVVKDEDGNIVFSADKDTGNVVIAALTAFRNELGEYLRIDPEEESISLGSSKNPIVLKIINNRIAFTQSGEEIAYFSDNQLHTKQLVVTDFAKICGLIITKNEDNDIFIS